MTYRHLNLLRCRAHRAVLRSVMRNVLSSTVVLAAAELTPMIVKFDLKIRFLGIISHMSVFCGTSTKFIFNIFFVKSKFPN